MKTYAKPRIHVETILGTDELLALNPHWVEDSVLGDHWEIDSGIDDVGDVVLQTKGTREEWGDLW